MKNNELYLETKVIKLGVNELNQCIKLDLKTFNGIWTRKQWHKELSDQSRLSIGVVKNKEIIGFACGWITLNEIDITLLAVNRLYQKQGIGKLVISELLKHAKKTGVSKATLEVKESNSAAIALYKSLNFQEVGIRANLYKDGTNGIIFQIIYH